MYIKEFQDAISLIDMVIRGIAPALIFYGKGGLSKSYTTVTTCEEKCPGKYVYHAGYMTGKQLFEYLKKYNGYIIILDDLVRLLMDDKAISILNAALWAPVGKKRIVQYTTTKNDGSTESMEFDFTGNVIVLINKIPRQRKLNVQALKSRVFVYEFKLTRRQILDISVRILREDSFYNLDDINLELSQEDRERLIKDFVENTSLYTENFSLREMRRFVMCYAYGKAACPDNPARHIELYKATTKIDEELSLVHDLMHSSSSVGNQVAIFIEKTGKSRSSFYRKKSLILEEERIDKKNETVSEQCTTSNDDTNTSIIDSEEIIVDPFSDNIHQDESNDADASVMKSDEITVDHFLDKIHGSDLEVEKYDRYYSSIKHNGLVLNYVKKTEHGIEVQYQNSNGIWKPVQIKNKEQFNVAINKTINLISKSIKEQKNLAVDDSSLNAFISFMKQKEPRVIIKEEKGKDRYTFSIDGIVFADVKRQKDGKLHLRWVEKTELTGAIINGEKDFFKASHKIKEFIDIYKKRVDIDRWMTQEVKNESEESEDIDKTENIENDEN